MTSALEQPSRATPAELDASVLELYGIRKSFGGAEALRGVSLNMIAGEILAIVGENGAGKSTLIKIAAGFLPAGSFEGGIRIGGRPVSFGSVHDAEAMGVLHIPQEVQVVPELSLAENVYLGREPGAVVRRREMIDGTAKALARLGLHFDPTMPIKRLGVGQQQAVLLARALVQETKFVLFDEPTASLTGTEVAKLFGVMHRLKAGGVGCVFVSHRLDEVLGIADRIAVMRNGALVAMLPRAEADAAKLVTLMVGRALGDLYVRKRPALGEVVLRARDYTVSSPSDPRRHVVERVSIELRAGEILALYGLVGAGRTEFARALIGAWPGRHEGQLFLRGMPVTIKNPRDAIKHGLCLLTEDRRHLGLFPLLGVGENINVGSLERVSRWQVIDSIAAVRRAAEFQERLRIRTSALSAPVSSLSGGNQQKTLLARLLAMKPSVLILDEPTRGIDVGAKAEVFDLLNELTAEGLGILLISSEVHEALAMGDRLVVLYKGRISGEFESGQVTREAVLAAATGGEAGMAAADGDSR